MEVVTLEIKPVGDSALAVYLGTHIDLPTNRTVHAMAARVSEALANYPRSEVIPGYVNFLITYDPMLLSYDDVVGVVQAAEVVDLAPEHRPQRFVLPTVYGGEYGPDLMHVAQFHGVTPDEIVALHAGRDYPIYCLGFSPGLPLCGGLPQTLHTPRLETPRTRVPAGSVAIGGSQTCVYPMSTPGGWRLLGRCPLRLFDLDRSPPVAYRPSDVIRFESVEEAEYRHLLDNPRMPVGELIADE